MAQNTQHEVLQRLYGELQQVEPKNERERELLAGALADIRRVLDPNDPDATFEDESFAERLQDTVYEFEGTHPGLTSAITIFIDSLSNMGL